MSDLQLFDNGEFQIELIPMGDSFKVQAPGLARALSFHSAKDMLRTVPDDEKGREIAPTPGGDQQIWFLTEAGFYRVLGQRQTTRIKNEDVRSQVARFQSWVYREVLPSIRKTGGYQVQPQPKPPQYAIPQSFADALELAAQQARAIESANRRMAELEPKAAQADQHRAADGCMAVGDFANKVKAWAKQNHGARVLHKEVWDFLGEIGLLIRGDTIRNNRPTAFAVERDFVREKDTEYRDGDGDLRISFSPRLTPAGEGWAWDRAVRRITERGSLGRLRMVRGAS